MKTRQYLKDYRPSAYQIPKIDLSLDIQPDYVRIASCMQVVRVSENAEALVLDGRGMQLLSLKLDGLDMDAARYAQTDSTLRIDGLPERCELKIEVRIDPYSNTSLEGFYAAGNMLCTQCESHGYSRITYGLDRPDVMSIYSVMLEADKQRYPVLLSNGELHSREELSTGRHRVAWHDPHPKPSYLFAVVAGDLACKTRPYTTSEGREVDIAFYCDHGIEDRLDHAIESLVRSMQWDEQRYGLAYDLNTYSVVVAGAFNMGAMENKGLNIFNPKYVLASPQTATDKDYAAVEAVIGHEYFHNWTGNRVTCRDWFQLALKEGLTVFRDQQFSGDCGAGPAQRIDHVKMLRGRQFAEDAGPLSHPVRPESYVEMNNFYTLTVYEKGAELVRLLHARLGEAGFRKGMDLYFERHDGQAVTIEDFLAAHADANEVNTDLILLWYGQAGTPLVRITDSYADGVYTLHCTQHVPSNPAALPVLIPMRLSLLLPDGTATLVSTVLEFDRAQQSWEFPVSQKPVPVLFEALSAPVKWEYDYSREALDLILTHAQDPFSRWEAAQRIYLAQIDAHYEGRTQNGSLDVFIPLLTDPSTDPAVTAALLSPPRADELSDRYSSLDPLKLADAVMQTELNLAQCLGRSLAKAYAQLQRPASPWRFDPSDAALRCLRGRLLELWVLTGEQAARDAAVALFDAADNLTDRLAAMKALNAAECAERDTLLQQFYLRYEDDRLVLDRWFALQAARENADTIKHVESLLAHPRFARDNPNRVRSVLSTFALTNFAAFYAGDGAGIRLHTQQCLNFDVFNPQLASRLVTAFSLRDRLCEPYRSQIDEALKELLEKAKSPDVREQVSRMSGA
jgi:aminopeptidase N